MSDNPFRIAFVPGVTPDKWLRIWAERSADAIEATPVPDAAQLAVLHDRTADMCFLRLPVDRDGLHVIPLYREVPVVVLPKGHLLTALDEVSTADLAGEQAVDLTALTTKQAVEVIASGTGYVVVPMSVARLHQRKDVEARPVTDVEQSQVGLAWRVDNEDPRIERFIGIVRGRTERSSRGEPAPVPRAARTRPPATGNQPRRRRRR